MLMCVKSFIQYSLRNGWHLGDVFLKSKGCLVNLTHSQFCLLKSALWYEPWYEASALFSRHWVPNPITVSWASPSSPYWWFCVKSFILFGDNLFFKQGLCGHSKNKEPILLLEKGTKPLISRHWVPIPITVCRPPPSCCVVHVGPYVSKLFH